MTATIASALIGGVVTLLVTWLQAWTKSAKSDAALIEQGADDADAKANKESTDALSRMAASNAQPRSRSLIADRLRHGSA